MKELTYFIIISLFDVFFLFFSLNYFLEIQDKWKRMYAKNPSILNLFLGMLLPTVFALLIVIPSIVVPREFIKRFPLNIHELWAAIPVFLISIYCLIYKSEEISKVYSKVDKRKLSE